jgi:hypothetical protein
VQALVDVVEDGVLGQAAEAVAHRHGELILGGGVADRHRPRAHGSGARVRLDLGEDLVAALVDGRVVERVHEQLFADLADGGAHLRAGRRFLGVARTVSIAVERPWKSRMRK